MNKIKFIEKEEFYQWLKSLKDYLGVSSWDKKFFGDMRISVLYNCKLLALYEDDKIIHVMTYTITRGYMNIYYRYVVPNKRGKGASTKLMNYVIENEEFDRMYARASTIEAVAYYYSKGFTFYGEDKNGVLLAELDLIVESKTDRKCYKYCINTPKVLSLKEIQKNLIKKGHTMDEIRKFRLTV